MINKAVIDENNIVINIVVCNDNDADTSNLITYTDINPAYIGGDYVDGYFYPEQPNPTWVRDKGKWIDPNAPKL